jgi:heme A synthase
MKSHFLLLLLFSFFVAVVFAALLREEPREQLRLGAMMFGGLIGAAVLLGWIMYPFPL